MPPGLRVPSWLIDYMLGAGEAATLSEPPARRASEPIAYELEQRFFAGVSPKREHQRLFGCPSEALVLLERVCARARLRQLHADLRCVRAGQLRAEAHRAAHLAALRECALVLTLPAAPAARSDEGFAIAQLGRDFGQLAKHLPLCATIEEVAQT
jgi:hypothetical protein